MSQQQPHDSNITNQMDDDRDEDYETEEEEDAFINEEDIDHVAGEYDENDKPPSDDEEEDEWMDDDEEDAKNRPLRNVPDYSTSSFNEHTDAIYSISVVENGPNEFLCVTSSGDDSAYLWTFNTQTLTTTPIKRLSGHTDTVLQSKFNFDKSLIATAGMDGTVKIWNAKSGDLISSLDGPAESIEWIDWHPKGNIVIGGSADSTTWMWNTQKELCLNVFSGHSDSVTSGCFSTDGKLVVTASEDSTVKVWNPKTAECTITYSAHEKNIKSFCEEPITVLKCSQSNPSIFLCGSLDGSVALCQLEQQRVLSYLKNKHAHTNSVEDVLFHPDQQHLLVSAGMDGQIVLWDTQSSTARQVLKNYPLQEQSELSSTDANTGGSSSSTTMVSTDLNFDTSAALVGVTHIQFDASRPYILYSGDIQGNIFSWDVRVGKVVKMYQGHADVISDFTQSHDYIFSVSEDKRALIFNKQ
ncbi:hypothetical protein FDP41_009046 [Naegleria fowleri]|uniref:Uncharacterized protein n=1 Tax=Naegleria fowleri TaxID=5763 RepID=A0A6A5B463_NAEFO|nr:uncharacterized protein FDP41_009046 [Naegleria fowleri]KAF0972797.1 hypothetical protein FDP41_009046 [Naegleria fowleri]CAG4719572.1 unnamed protein product [Naegleria fowleri]